MEKYTLVSKRANVINSLRLVQCAGTPHVVTVRHRSGAWVARGIRHERRFLKAAIWRVSPRVLRPS